MLLQILFFSLTVGAVQQPAKTHESPLSPESLSAQLKKSCIAHRTQFDELTKLQTQLTLDLFFGAFNIPMLPAGGTLLGTIRHRLLCAPWDDDLDFNIPTDEYDRLLGESTPMRTNSKHVIDISDQELGRHFANQIRTGFRCHYVRENGQVVPPHKHCPKIVTLAIEDPGPLSTNEEAVFFHQYFHKKRLRLNDTRFHIKSLKDVRTICLSLLFLEFGFLNVLVHEECTSVGMPAIKVTDIFPLTFTTYGWTCPAKDYASGVASKACAARANYAQPIVTSTARMMTVENGGNGDGIRLLVPKDVYSIFFLKGNYGDDVLKHAMVCPHFLYSRYSKCAEAVKPISMVQIRALMSEIPECYGYDGDGTTVYSLTDKSSNGESHVEEITKLRDQMYLRVAQLSIMDKQEDERYWKPLYYYENVKLSVTTPIIRGLSNIVIRRKKTLPAPGILRLANVKGKLFWTDDDPIL